MSDLSVWRRRWPWFVVGFFAFGAIDLTWLSLRQVHAAQNLPPVAVPSQQELEPLHLDPRAVLEGKPDIRAKTFGQSLDGKTIAGIWECVGPAKFEWHFKTDETVHALEGEVHIEYDGKVQTLRAGDAAFFPAGITAVWNVPEKFRKSFLLSEPGRMVRLLRRLM